MAGLIKRAIFWYLRQHCGGAFHFNAYGDSGRYVVIVDEPTYNRLRWRVSA